MAEPLGNGSGECVEARLIWLRGGLRIEAEALVEIHGFYEIVLGNGIRGKAGNPFGIRGACGTWAEDLLGAGFELVKGRTGYRGVGIDRSFFFLDDEF